MSYVTRDSVTAKLPERFLVEALDDDGDGEEDPGIFDTILIDAETEVNGYIEGRYALPLVPVPAKLQTAALVIVLEELYRRRGHLPDNNPYTKRASEQRASLRRIQAGDDNLLPTVQQSNAAVTVVTEPARTHSTGGRLLA